MDGAEIRRARHSLGLSQAGLADALKMTSPNGARRVRAWELGEMPITGPAEVALRLMLEKEGLE